MDPDAVALLRCPHCHRALVSAERTLRCEAGHAFDVARQGYVNLLPGPSPHAGDTAAMVAARLSALSGGALEAVTRALVTAVRAAMPPDGALVDVGAGPGHHAAAVLDELPGAIGLALDVSVYAARRAARAHPRLTSVVCDAWSSLPLRDGVAGVVCSAFAPRNLEEAARVLRPDGALVVVTPTPDHLQEVVERLAVVRVDPDKAERLAADLAGSFHVTTTAAVRQTVPLTRADVRAVVAMGPSAHHLDDDELAMRTDTLPEPLAVTVSAEVRTCHPDRRR